MDSRYYPIDLVKKQQLIVSLFTGQQDEDPDPIPLNIQERNPRNLTEKETKAKTAPRRKRTVTSPGVEARRDVRKRNQGRKCECS